MTFDKHRVMEAQRALTAAEIEYAESRNALAEEMGPVGHLLVSYACEVEGKKKTGFVRVPLIDDDGHLDTAIIIADSYFPIIDVFYDETTDSIMLDGGGEDKAFLEASEIEGGVKDKYKLSSLPELTQVIFISA